MSSLPIYNYLQQLIGLAYNISAQTAQKTPLPKLLYFFVTVEACLFAYFVAVI
jgi:hypothetical protein